MYVLPHSGIFPQLLSMNEKQMGWGIDLVAR